MTAISGWRRRWPTFIFGLAVIATLTGIGTIVATEVVMVPTAGERTRLIALIVALASVAVTITVVMRLFAPRSVSRRLLLAALSGPIIIAFTLSAGSQSMFLNNHDLQFLLILLAFATVLAVAVVHTLARPLTEDLAALTDVARRVGGGDLGARAELGRMDEVGELAWAMDSMIEQIATSRSARDASEHERSVTLASLSHDARTPLTSMRLATEALLDGVAPDPDRYLRNIAADIRAVETLIDDLFTVGQIEAGRLSLQAQPVDVLGAAHESVAVLDPIARDRGISIEVSDIDSFTASADAKQLQRVFQNLVSNAVTHSPEGGTVSVVLEPDRCKISVTDEGEGLSLIHISEPTRPY